MSKSSKKVNKLDVETKMSILLEHGRKEITTKKQLEKCPIGSPISYLNTDGVFKPAGYLLKFGDEWFIYITPDLKSKFRVRYVNVQKMWVGNVHQTSGDIVSLSTDQIETNFPVKLGHFVIYYGRNTFQMKRFMHTVKYKRMKLWYDFFIGK